MMTLSKLFVLISIFTSCLSSAQAQLIVDHGFKILKGQQKVNSELLNQAVPLENSAPTRAANMAPPSVNNPGPSTMMSYTSEVVGPTLYVRSTHYFSDFPIAEYVPEDMMITNVSWTYSLSTHPLGMEVALCWNRSEVCQDINLAEKGKSSMFNGKDPQIPFTIHYRYGGKGAISPPINGQKNQIIVTYTRIPTPQE